MKTLISAGVISASLALSACAPPVPETGTIRTEVDYHVPVKDAVKKAGLTATKTSFAEDVTTEGVGRETQYMKVVDVPTYNHVYKTQSFRKATPLELIAFTAQHPEEMKGHTGVCGAFKHPGFLRHARRGQPVISDGARLGIWTVHCEYYLLVQE